MLWWCQRDRWRTMSKTNHLGLKSHIHQVKLKLLLQFFFLLIELCYIIILMSAFFSMKFFLLTGYYIYILIILFLFPSNEITIFLWRSNLCNTMHTTTSFLKIWYQLSLISYTIYICTLILNTLWMSEYKERKTCISYKLLNYLLYIIHTF